MTDPSGDDRDKFGTEHFYSALGRAFVIMCAVIPGLFLIEFVNKETGDSLNDQGAIVPHSLHGLDGIVLAPFLHQSFPHLYGNSIPLLLTGTFVLAGGVKRFLLVTGFIALISGLGVWLFGTGPTVGASGVIFGYLGYLFMRGLVERNWWNIAVALLVGLLYGSQLRGALPGDPNISWQAHMFGLIGGLVAAILFRIRRPRPVRVAPAEDLPATLQIPPAS
jgi:membrane associated rhomboid family serine protease